MSKIELIIGPMFSGKTSELIRRINRYIIKKKKCLVINHHKDIRYSDNNCIVSHNNISLEGLKLNNLNQNINIMLEYDVVGIDEAQFFDEIDLVETTEFLANNGKIVIIAGLNSDFNRKSFDSISAIIPKVDTLDILYAICINCNNDASFTKKKIKSNQIIEIGGIELYEPVCRKCFHINIH